MPGRKHTEEFSDEAPVSSFLNQASRVADSYLLVFLFIALLARCVRVPLAALVIYDSNRNIQRFHFKNLHLIRQGLRVVTFNKDIQAAGAVKFRDTVG